MINFEKYYVILVLIIRGIIMKELAILKTSALIDKDSFVFINKIKKRIGSKKYFQMLNKIFMNIVVKYANKNSPVIRNTVKYQRKKSNLKLFHYSIDSNVYEACLDVRKYNKVSVSLILNEAIRELISDSVSELSIFQYNDCFLQFIFLIQKLDSYQVIYSISLYYDGKRLVQTAKTEVKKT